MLNSVKIRPISEVQSLAMDNNSDENEEKRQIIHKTRSSRHRALRVRHHGMDPDDQDGDNDLDQTPMDLAQVIKQKPRPTTVGGHRYIPSYDSQISNNDIFSTELGDRERSNSYVPWHDERQRQDSFISELGDFDFRASEIQTWPPEGTDGVGYNHRKHDSSGNVGGYTPVAQDAYSSNPGVLHNKFPSNASLYIVSRPREPTIHNELLKEHRVEDDDENVGDSIF